MLIDFGRKLRLKWGDVKTRMKGDLTAVVWKDIQNENTLKNMHPSPAEGNLCDENRNALKPARNCSRHMGCIDKSDSMMNSYSISKHTWNWTRENILCACNVAEHKFDRHITFYIYLYCLKTYHRPDHLI
jgi:hypothetical protein